MRKLLLLTMVTLFIYFNAWADDKNVVLTTNKPSKDETNEYLVPTIPVHVNINNTLLGIHFDKAKQVFVSVIGPDGVVYQKEVTTSTAKSIYVDLAQYQQGEYSIYFLDVEGNQVSRYFLSEKE